MSSELPSVPSFPAQRPVARWLSRGPGFDRLLVAGFTEMNYP